MSDGQRRLPPDVRALLRDARFDEAIPDEARARLAERLATTVPGFGAVPPSAKPVAPSHAPWSSAAKLLGTLVLATASVGTAAALLQRGGMGQATLAHRASMREPSPHPKDVASEAARDLAAPTSFPAPRSRPTAPSAARATLSEERRLVDAARASLVGGEPEEALTLAKMHAARFVHGILAEERDAIRVRALARLGRVGEARAALDAMRIAYPTSFLLDGVEAEVGTIP